MDLFPWSSRSNDRSNRRSDHLVAC